MALPFQLDGGAGSKASFGLIVLQTDEAIETELTPVFSDPKLALYHTRLPSAIDATPGTLKRMEHDLPGAIALLPQARELDVVAYACTSGATLIGHGKIAKMVKKHYPKASVTDPMTAVIAALRHLQVTRIAVVTPYVPDVTQKMKDHLERHEFRIARLGSFEQIKEATVARISEASLLEAITDIGVSDEVEAVFTSCTNLRSFNILESAEERIKKPVISSNQALAWHMLVLAGMGTDNRGPGRLFTPSPAPAHH